MIKLVIDGNETILSTDQYKTFGQLYESFAPRNKVLRKLVINDIEVPPHKVSELREAVLEENTRIDMEFTAPEKFVVEILPGVLDYVNSAINLLPQFAESIRAGDPKAFDSLKSLSDSVSALENLRQSIIKIIPIEPFDFSEAVSRLNRIVQVMEKNDRDELADALENDMSAVFRIYATFFSKVLNKIGGK